ncbi:phosphoglucomutase/phosphomannomutase family protein [Natrinema gelatinilyticum]|uniref:phosphoglucomutase/phosphomannomutase family protein n=1 Tax=Natrinema gelatinilyticum TaxID=2961571 RepID=UPI0020C4E110|nr:phosphoglucomutase/phosphomannomutase family protein [Natrinema gelatinilyticum]
MKTDPITFGTDGWRTILEEFTVPRVRAVGQAVSTYLTDNGDDRPVAIGYDARERSAEFAEELADVLCANGFDVVLPERDRPTPVFAFGIVDRNLAGALVITASHNPPEYNGVKFIPSDGAPALPSVTDAIADRLAEPQSVPSDEHGTVHTDDFVSPHAEHVLELVDSNLTEANLTVAYDAMHGSGRGTTDALLKRAGVSVDRLRCESDPTFGGSAPEPAPENLETLIEHVQSHEADLGIANDGDADRIAIVTPKRGYLDENLFFAALYDYLLEQESGSVIRTVSTTHLLDRIADAHDETAYEVPVGFKWVAQGIADHEALVGGEESGGFTIDGHVREKDGVLMALVAAAMHAEEPLDDRVDRLLETHGTIVQDKRSVACPDEQKAAVLSALEDEIPNSIAGVAIEDVNTADGFKLTREDGSWLLIRPSGTEPVLRVYAEAGETTLVQTLLDAGEELVRDIQN